MARFDDTLLQQVHTVAEEVGIIFAGHIAERERDEVKARLLDFLKRLHAGGGNQVECMVLIGALAAMGFDDFTGL